MDADNVSTPMRRCVICGAAGVWRHAVDGWLCEDHAPRVRDRGRCVVANCRRPGAWCHPIEGWMCEDHAPPLHQRGHCVIKNCGNPAAWQRPETHEWVCLVHAPSEVR